MSIAWELIFAGIKFREITYFLTNSQKLVPIPSKLKSFNHTLQKRKLNINIFLQICWHDDFFNIEAAVRRCSVKTAVCWKGLYHGCFPVDFPNFFITAFWQNTRANNFLHGNISYTVTHFSIKILNVLSAGVSSTVIRNNICILKKHGSTLFLQK